MAHRPHRRSDVDASTHRGGVRANLLGHLAPGFSISTPLKKKVNNMSAREAATNAATYTSAGGAILFGMSANEIAAAVGAAVAILTFLTNLWYKHQHLQLAKAKAECVKPGFPCPEMPPDE